ncbi:MAG TPA: metal-sensing transcriptional repressor [Usitatibacteraceae bacterium]
MSKLRDSDKKTALIMRLRRVEGQLRGVQKLIDEEADCEKIAQQLAASRKALDKTFFAMVGCIIEQEDAVAPAKRGRTGKTPSAAASRGAYVSAMLSRFA